MGFLVGFWSFMLQIQRVFFIVIKANHFSFFVNQGVSVEAVDPVFQAKMLDMLKQTGRYFK